MMSNIDNNWQFTQKMISENKKRIFIKNYQSSPIELTVSVLNQRLKKDENAS